MILRSRVAIPVIITLSLVGIQSIAISVSLCQSVCMSVRSHINPHGQPSRNFLCMLPVAVARSSSDDNTVRYVLPVLLMTSCYANYEFK